MYLSAVNASKSRLEVSKHAITGLLTVIVLFEMVFKNKVQCVTFMLLIFPFQFCRKVWLGLYDERQGTQTESRDESKVKDFMAQKYERKRYYVAPTETMKEEAKRMNESAISKQPGTRPLKSLLGENAPRLQVSQSQVKDGIFSKFCLFL